MGSCGGILAVYFHDIEPLILHHHERFDGTGYPDGLKGEGIPLGVRILTVCDAFETMLAGRKYLAKMSLEDAISNMQSGAGHQFDTEVVKALFSALPKHPELFELSHSAIRCLASQRKKLTRPPIFESNVFM